MQATPWDPDGVETLLDREGRLSDPAVASDLDLRGLYKVLVHSRALDVRLGRLGLPMWVSGAGEEAATVLVGGLANPDDWVYPGTRHAGLAMARGVSVQEIVAQALGSETSFTKGRLVPGPIASSQHHIAAPTESLGMSVAFATGRARGQALDGSGAITFVLCGEGLASTGAFHESLAIAVQNELPLVIVCKTQPWPSGAPSEAGQFGDTAGARMKAMGLWSRRCDGADVVSTYAALAQAAKRARDGEGPCFVEVFVTPLSQEVPAHRDPIERLRRCLDKSGEWTQTFQDVTEAEFRGRFDKALAELSADEADAP